MARRRSVDSRGTDRFADRRVDTWLSDADRDAVAAAGGDTAALARVIGGLHAEARLSTIPADGRAGWALSCLAAGHRSRAVVAWARANGVSETKALAHYSGHPAMVVGA